MRGKICPIVTAFGLMKPTDQPSIEWLVSGTSVLAVKLSSVLLTTSPHHMPLSVTELACTPGTQSCEILPEWVRVRMALFLVCRDVGNQVFLVGDRLYFPGHVAQVDQQDVDLCQPPLWCTDPPVVLGTDPA
jgi:hypothetical protein